MSRAFYLPITMEDHNTSIPGNGTDPLEPDFEKMLANEGLDLEGRDLPAPDKRPVDQPKIPETPKPEDKKPEDTKVEPDKQPTDDKKPDDDKDGKSKDPDEWRKIVANKRQERSKDIRAENDNLKKEIETLKAGKTPDAHLNPTDPPKTDEPVVLTTEQKALADKYGIEHDDYLKMFPTKVVEKEVIKNGLSPEQEAMFSSIASERETTAIQLGYNKDFNSNVLPLIKAEYPNISDSKVEEIKSKIFDKIQEDQYSMTPLGTLYKGEDEFRGVVNIPKRGPDEGSKVPGNNGSNKVYDFDNVTETDMKDSSFPFEKYSNYMASKENGAKRN